MVPSVARGDMAVHAEFHALRTLAVGGARLGRPPTQPAAAGRGVRWWGRSPWPPVGVKSKPKNHDHRDADRVDHAPIRLHGALEKSPPGKSLSSFVRVLGPSCGHQHEHPHPEQRHDGGRHREP